MELAQASARFGVGVTVVEALDRVLPLEEPEASEVINSVFRREGIDVYAGARATKVDRDGERIRVVLHDGRAVAGDRLLVATGRRADLRILGVGSIGLDEEALTIAVDGHLRAAPGVWAVGDVTGVGAFTHIALYLPAIAVADILGQQSDPADYRALPRVTFTDPEVASVGLTEVEATRRGLQVRWGPLSCHDLPAAGSTS